MVGGAARLVSAWYVLQFANRRHCVASYLYLIGGTELADPRVLRTQTKPVSRHHPVGGHREEGRARWERPQRV